MSYIPIRKDMPEGYRPVVFPKALQMIHGKPMDEAQRNLNENGRLDEGQLRITDKGRINLPCGPELNIAADWYVHVLQLPAIRNRMRIQSHFSSPQVPKTSYYGELINSPLV